MHLAENWNVTFLLIVTIGTQNLSFIVHFGSQISLQVCKHVTLCRGSMANVHLATGPSYLFDTILGLDITRGLY